MTEDQSKVIVYDNVVEVIKESDINKVNKLLSQVEGIGWYTYLVYDVIGCVTETVEPGISKLFYILGKKYKYVDKFDESLSKKK